MIEASGNFLVDWNLDKVFCVTIDNVASNSVMVT